MNLILDGVFLKKVKRGLRKINNYLELPEGLLTGGARVEIQSNERALVDCKCTVLQYNDKEIKINTGTGIITFCGKNLSISALQHDSAVIVGEIEKVLFEN